MVVLVAVSPSQEFSKPSCPLQQNTFCVLCLGFLSTLSAHEHERVKASWRVWGELEGSQALESFTRVTLGVCVGVFLPSLRPSFLIHPMAAWLISRR